MLIFYIVQRFCLLTQNHRGVSVITQNVDGLHHIAGRRDVIDLHGNIFATKCNKCDFRGNIVDEFSDLPPSCQDMWYDLVKV